MGGLEEVRADSASMSADPGAREPTTQGASTVWRQNGQPMADWRGQDARDSFSSSVRRRPSNPTRSNLTAEREVGSYSGPTCEIFAIIVWLLYEPIARLEQTGNRAHSARWRGRRRY